MSVATESSAQHRPYTALAFWQSTSHEQAIFARRPAFGVIV
jgi:hypothetical protein